MELSTQEWNRFKYNCIIVSGRGVGNSVGSTKLLYSNIEYDMNVTLINCTTKSNGKTIHWYEINLTDTSASYVVTTCADLQ